MSEYPNCAITKRGGAECTVQAEKLILAIKTLIKKLAILTNFIPSIPRMNIKGDFTKVGSNPPLLGQINL